MRYEETWVCSEYKPKKSKKDRTLEGVCTLWFYSTYYKHCFPNSKVHDNVYERWIVLGGPHRHLRSAQRDAAFQKKALAAVDHRIAIQEYEATNWNINHG